MYKITTLLDMAKENNNLKSDRELGKLLGIKNMANYRTRGAIPSDDTAKMLAKLTELSYEAVLASCHGATAKKNNDKDAVKAWRNIFNMTKAASVAVLMVVLMSIPSPSYASTGEVVGNIQNTFNIYYATFII